MACILMRKPAAANDNAQFTAGDLMRAHALTVCQLMAESLVQSGLWVILERRLIGLVTAS
jgi:hypothetical protein